MGAETSIAWTDHTFNPWIGCTKVSEGCRNCYAAALDNRWGHKRWGPGAAREVTSASNWKQPLAWNKAALAEGRRHRVFCASLADVFDAEAPEGAREWLWELIRATPALDWQLLTKRPERVATLLPWSGGAPWANVWIGTSVEDQRAADERIPHLLRVPAAVRFLSCEPLLEAVMLHRLRNDPTLPGGTGRSPIQWVIVGGESGAGARPMRLEWAQSLIDQCKAAGVACFTKQLGKLPVWPAAEGATDYVRCSLIHDAKGGDPAEWPADLRVREFPEAAP